MRRSKFQIIWVPVESIRAMPGNPARRTKDQLMKFKDLLRRMDRVGWEDFRPALVSKEGIIGDGNRRYRAACILGMKEIPVIFTERPHPELFEGNTGADAVNNADWLVAYRNGIAALRTMPAEVAECIRCLEGSGGTALLDWLIERRVSPKVWDVTYRAARYCERTDHEFITQATKWLVIHKSQDYLAKLIRDAIVTPQVLRLAIEHDLTLKDATLKEEEEETS